MIIIVFVFVLLKTHCTIIIQQGPCSIVYLAIVRVSAVIAGVLAPVTRLCAFFVPGLLSRIIHPSLFVSAYLYFNDHFIMRDVGEICHGSLRAAKGRFRKALLFFFFSFLNYSKPLGQFRSNNM